MSSNNAQSRAVWLYVMDVRARAWRLALAGVLAYGLVFAAQAHGQGLARADDTSIAERLAERQAIVESVRDPVATLSSFPTVSAAWIKHVDQQFATSLKSPIEAVRHQTLQDVIYIAKFHSDTVTLKKVVSPLLNIYLFDKDDRYRLMAVSALHALGDAYGMQRLREEVREVRSKRLKKLTLAALNDYYKAQR